MYGSVNIEGKIVPLIVRRTAKTIKLSTNTEAISVEETIRGKNSSTTFRPNLRIEYVKYFY